ncbi:MAG: DNA replication and repair protein RecF [Candidatus Curtissbacteria bacterium]|nr:DNA replication and repair protein RecF [Candidatus Curtissbacteria bacterium]
MQILNLHVTNFRNFSSKKFVFDPKLTVVVGQNGSGKSNMLEAVGLLAATRAKKVDTDLDLVKFGQSEAKIEGYTKQNSEEEVKLTINLQVVDERLVRKAYFIDEIKKRLIDFTEHFSVIVFEPSDLDLISGSPSERRHHLDILLSVLDRDYWRAISAYGKVVTRRNRVLQRIQEGKAKKTELDFWDERLLEHGGEVSRKRKEFFEFINFVNGEKGAYKWELEESVLSDEKLERNRERDIAAGVTLSGPHRDDFKFLFRGKNLEYFGSRGEQRMSVLALKLSELELFNAKRGDRPILALDDIFSELDWEHREAVLGVINKQQTIITAAEPNSIPRKLAKTSKIIEL